MIRSARSGGRTRPWSARAEIEARAQARAALAQAEAERQRAEAHAQVPKGGKPDGDSAPRPPSEAPRAKDQYHFTDPESRMMKAGHGDHFEQAYNAQAAVEVESRLIVGQGVSNAPNDKEQLVRTVGAIVPSAGPVETVWADSGFFSERALKAVEQSADGTPTGVEVLAAVEKTSPHRSVQDLEKKADPVAPVPGASVIEGMRYRLKTPAGRAKDRLRQQTVEPVLGMIKSVMGFRRFLLRGLAKVRLEWTRVSTAYHLKRLHRMATAVG